MSLRVAIHQPAYLPWLGYFNRISQADVFVFLDSVQFEKNSFINRNKIKTPQGPQWLTLPVLTKDYQLKPLCELEIDATKNWKAKHLKAIEANYKKSKNFASFFPQLSEQIEVASSNLSDLCFDQLRFWLSQLQLNTQIIRSKDLELKETKSNLILEICQKLKATHYISGPLGRNYLEIAAFEAVSIQVSFQHFEPPRYSQLFGDFEPYLSVVDAFFNVADVRSLVL